MLLYTDSTLAYVFNKSVWHRLALLNTFDLCTEQKKCWKEREGVRLKIYFKINHLFMDEDWVIWIHYYCACSIEIHLFKIIQKRWSENNIFKPYGSWSTTNSNEETFFNIYLNFWSTTNMFFRYNTTCLYCDVAFESVVCIDKDNE